MHAGIAHWINTYYKLKGDKQVAKTDELVNKVKEWVDKQYDDGRVTVIADFELEEVIADTCKALGITLGA